MASNYKGLSFNEVKSFIEKNKIKEKEEEVFDLENKINKTVEMNKVYGINMFHEDAKMLIKENEIKAIIIKNRINDIEGKLKSGIYITPKGCEQINSRIYKK